MPEVVRLRTGRQPLVGRDAAVAALVGAFDDAAQGVGGGIFVTGEPGIGKTRLVEELTDLARQRGACVNWSACRESDGAPAFWPWVQVIRSCRQHVCAPPPEMNPRIEDALALVDEPIGTAEPLGDQARFKLFDSMATLLTNSCASSPLLIVLDDLQWADLPSLHFLSFLLPMLRSHRILLVGTSREPELEAGGDAATLLLDVMRGAPVIALGGLRREGVEELLSSTTGGATADDLVRLGVPYQALVEPDLTRAEYEEVEAVQKHVSAGLIGERESATKDQVERMLEAVVGVHHAFRGRRVTGLTRLRDDVSLLIDLEPELGNGNPLPALVVEGWSRFSDLVPSDVAGDADEAFRRRERADLDWWVARARECLEAVWSPT